MTTTTELIERVDEWMRAQGFIDGIGAITQAPRHGSCCTCSTCGFHYDDCRCELNERNVAWFEFRQTLK